MELAQLISPAGEWGKVWLAAHWDRKLKKQDYIEANLRALLDAFYARRAIISLRTIGHLLLGACKIYARKCLYFEEESVEVRTRLMLAFSNPAERPAGEEKRSKDRAAATQLRALRQLDPERAEARHEETLQRGKRHMARLEDITLKEPRRAATDPRLERRELFGAMSGAELAAAVARLRGSVLPEEAPAGGGGAGALGAVELEEHFETLPLVALEPPPPPEAPRGGREAAAAGAAGREVAAEAETPMPLEMDLLGGPLALFPEEVSPARGEAEEEALALAPPAALLGEALAAAAAAVAAAEEAAAEAGAEDAAEDAAEAAEAAEERPAGEGALAEPPSTAKRRRRTHFEYDEATEIPKETYQGFVNDRSAITRKNLLDYTILLPHYSPNLPNFTTTFTELCPQLCETLLLGSRMAEKRRKQAQEEELKSRGELWPAHEATLGVAAAAAAAAPAVDDAAKLPMSSIGILSPLLSEPIPPDKAGLRSPEAPRSPVAVEQRAAAGQAEAVAEALLLRDAPSTMGAVVTGNMDQEDQSGNAAVRIGYSGRTEKMHRFLAREFKESRANSLSYEALCRQQGAGRRELIAGCFFELLVLRTNGVIGLQQDEPQADIRISKSKLWTK